MISTEKTNLNKAISGFVKIWKTSPITGESQLVIDQPNMILYGGARLMSYALSGRENAKIWGMYIGFNNNQNGVFTRPVIDASYSQPFSGLSTQSGFGYLREPLTFTPTYLSDGIYIDNTVLFSVMVTASTSVNATPFLHDVSRIYEVALVGASDPTNSSKDIVFSRTGFNPVKYDTNFNFTITWGIKFLVD
jgi:hypothetical protein